MGSKLGANLLVHYVQTGHEILPLYVQFSVRVDHVERHFLSSAQTRNGLISAENLRDIKLPDYLLRAPLLEITSASRTDGALPDPMHAAITGTKDGRGTFSKRTVIA